MIGLQIIFSNYIHNRTKKTNVCEWWLSVTIEFDLLSSTPTELV